MSRTEQCFSVSIEGILAQNHVVGNEEVPREFLRRAYELDDRYAELQEKEALLRREKDKDMTYEEYLRWQANFDKVNQEIVDVLCELHETE